MIQQTYYYQKFPNMLDEALEKYDPGRLKTFKLRTVQAMENISLAWASDAMEIKFGQYSDNPVPEEDWNPINPHFREGIKWHDGFTEAHAIVLSRKHDRDANMYLSLKNTDVWSIESIGGMLAGNIFDPINYIPYIGATTWALRFAKTAKIGSKIHFIKPLNALSKKKKVKPLSDKKIDKLISEPAITEKFTEGTFKYSLKTAGKWVTDATLGEMLFQTIKQTSKAARGDRVDFVAASVDVAIASLTGGVLSTFPIANRIRKTLTPEIHFNNMRAKAAEMRDGISGKFLGKGSETEPELNPQQIRDNLETEIKSYDDKDVMNTDASMEYIKDLGVSTGKRLVEFTKRLYKAALCINKNG